MRIERRISVPTGDILIVRGERGLLECLSLGDYGKDVNLKADFIGLSREPDRVRHTRLLPLSEKWVITISTQYGCSMGCRFCDVPKVGPGHNATLDDMMDQVEVALSVHPEMTTANRLNIHFARMGEPLFNLNVLDAAVLLRGRYGEKMRVHPVVSTAMPSKVSWRRVLGYLQEWCNIKNVHYQGEAGLQISVNSTDEDERRTIFSGNALTLAQIGSFAAQLPTPRGRKYTLNFAVAGWQIDPEVLLRYFDPAHWCVKLTPMHRTATAEANSIRTAGDYATVEPYRQHEDALKAAGYDVLVFIASEYEDLGRITCGNAILSGTMPDAIVPHIEVPT